MPNIDIEDQVAELYGEPLDRFTAARNDLASQLKKAGNNEAAERVRSLKKPSVSAGVVNQLVRTREIDVKRLLQAGERVEKAQQNLLAGSKTADFDDAREKERAAVQALRSAATEVHPEISGSMLERVTRSLEAASSIEGRARLKEGRLTEDLEPPGFEILSGLGVGSPAKASKKSKPKQKLIALTHRRAAAREQLKTAQAEAKKREKEAQQAEADAAKAVKAAESARKRSESSAAELKSIEDELAKMASKN